MPPRLQGVLWFAGLGARMNWRDVGKKGERFPKWMRDLDGKHGAYAIRTRGFIFSTVVYVGESHTGNLYKTVTRHLQVWSGQYAPAQTDPGHTYARGDCEVAVEVTKSGAKALALQAEWIRKLKPRDNVALVDEEAPF